MVHACCFASRLPATIPTFAGLLRPPQWGIRIRPCGPCLEDRRENDHSNSVRECEFGLTAGRCRSPRRLAASPANTNTFSAQLLRTVRCSSHDSTSTAAERERLTENNTTREAAAGPPQHTLCRRHCVSMLARHTPRGRLSSPSCPWAPRAAWRRGGRARPRPAPATS